MCWLSSSFTNLLWYHCLNMYLQYGAHTPRRILKSLSWCRRHVTKAILGYQDIWTMRPDCIDIPEEHRRIKDLVTCYKYINGFIDVNNRTVIVLRTRSSHNLKFHSAKQTLLSFPFLTMLSLLGILSLMLLFLLRMLFCVRNICPCIIV